MKLTWLLGKSSARRCPVCGHKMEVVNLALRENVKVCLCYNHQQVLRFSYDTGKLMPIDWPVFSDQRERSNNSALKLERAAPRGE